MSQRASCSKAIKAMLAATLAPLIFAACAHTILSAQVVPPAPVGTAKLHIKIDVWSDPSLTLHEPTGFYEKLNPALANTVRDALANDFETVEMVDDKQSVGDADLLAIPTTADVHYFSKRPVKLVVTFVEPKTGKTLAEFFSVKPIDFHAPGARVHLGTNVALMGLGPFIPLVEPTLQRHDSERFNAAFGPALIAMATDIADQASKDQAIGSLPIRGQPKIGR
jgi:hypothetical protein